MLDKMNKSKIIILIIAGILILTFIIVLGINNYTIGNKEDDGVKYLIGVSQANLQESWRIEVNKNIAEEASKYDDLRVVYTDALQDSQKQINDIKKLINLGVDLLIISPNDVNALESEISEAYAKIPVIIMDRKVSENDYTLFIGTDDKQIGIDSGQFALEHLGDKGGNVIEIIGQEDSPISVQRSDGFLQSISKNDKIKIIKTITGDWMKDNTEDILKQIIFDFSQIDVIFAHNDEMAMGAKAAAQDMRIGNICFIGGGGSENGSTLVKQGILNCTFTNTTGGKEAIEYALKILNKENDLPKNVILQSKMITKDTVD